MPYKFDSESFGQLLRDAENLRDAASTLERRLARLARIDGLPTSDSDPADIGEDLRRAYTASREQTEAVESVLRHFLGPREGGFRDRPVVLVVDDSHDAREGTALLLEQAGFRAVTAANGLEALIVAHYMRPSVALR